MKTIRIVGVPEHFNLPWQLAIEEGAFAERGIDLEWSDVPEGTGRMCEMLRTEETDLAIILTEGITKDIIAGSPARIIQEFIASPLYWGIHVDAHSSYKELKELKGKTAAISRFGSGSHLMAYINADNLGWDTEQLEFSVVNTIEGAVSALGAGEADYFMWEHFTTKPLVDKGIFRRLGDCPTPWPCFVIAASENAVRENTPALKHILEIINTLTLEFKEIPSIDRMLSNRYEQDLTDIREWLALTTWSQEQITPVTLKNVQDELGKLGIIKDRLSFSELTTTL
ncbi:substrate-binding domain-containing protein [Robertkochia flava]|uniref:substrate-binding domain-containing protein n=1 Tax=Robertkochia flava TaxID=3447986 RepID=UPI001CCF149B|nr:substrate-binding domain-containing protein [Robertkochia marina]